MRDLPARLRRIEGRLKKSDNRPVIFKVRWDHKEEDYQKQCAEYIANGGDPHRMIILIRHFGESQPNT